MLSKTTLNIPVVGWHVDERRSIPLGHVGENVVQRINFTFAALDTTVTYRLDFQQRTFTAWFALNVDPENNILSFEVPNSMLTYSGSATLQIVAVGTEENNEVPVAKTNRFSAKIFSAINADGEMSVDEVSEFEQMLAEYNAKLQEAIDAASDATSVQENVTQLVQRAADSATASATSATESANSAASAATSAEESAISAEHSAKSADQSALYADLASQAAEEKGYIFFDINNLGYLQMTYSKVEDIDFRLVINTGELEAIYA